jgi:eukaryotic-like serine/threonine-protein kinase
MEHERQIVAGDLQIDPRAHRVMLAGEEVPLTGKEYDLLVHLAERPGWVWSRLQLLQSVWGYDFGDPHVVDVHLANVRQKLGETAAAPRFIHTIRGAGYRFETRATSPASHAATTMTAAAPQVALESDVLVGRLPELAILRGALQAANSGLGRLVMIGGDVGIGKTRLAEELAREAAAQGIPVIWGLCREQAAAPWEPWPDIVKACLSLSGVPEAPTAQVGSAQRRTAQQLLFEEPAGVAPAGEPGEDPEWARRRVIENIGRLIAEAARRRPLLVILDDVHWADASSLLCLQELSRTLGPQRLLIVVTYRDFEVARSPLLGDVIADAARAGGRTLALGPLAEEEVGRLVAQSRGGTPALGLVRSVYETTGGNPFFVREVLRLLALRPGDDAAVSSLPQQEGVRQVIGRRMGVLSPDCLRLLELAAAIGVRFSALLVERAVGLTPNRCSALLDEAAAAHVVQAAGPGVFVFAHQLVRDVLYLGLSPAVAAMFHARIGAALEDLWAGDREAHATELAHHFLKAADANHAPRAFSYAVMAGRAARSRYAWQEAARWLEHGLGLRDIYPGCGGGPAEVAALYEELGDAHFLAGHLDPAVEAFERALQSHTDASPVDTGRRYRKVGGALVLTPQVARATLAYLEAERVMGEPGPNQPPEWWEEWLAVELERCWGHYYAAEFDGLARLAERIRPFVDARGAAHHRGAFYNCLWIGDEGVNRYVTSEYALGLARRSAEAYHAAGSLRSRGEGQWVISLALLWLPDHPKEALTELRRFVSLAEELGDATIHLESLWGLTMWHRWHGQTARVRELAEQSLALDSGKDIACYTPCARGNLAWVAYRAGDREQCRELATAALAAIQGDEEHVMAFQWHMRWPLLGAALAARDLEQAVAQAQALLRPDQQAMPGPLEVALAGFVAAPSAAAAEPFTALAAEHGYL